MMQTQTSTPPLDAWYLLRSMGLDADELLELSAPVRPEPQDDAPIIWWPEQRAA